MELLLVITDCITVFIPMTWILIIRFKKIFQFPRCFAASFIVVEADDKPLIIVWYIIFSQIMDQGF